jgi:hypothetical protein
MVRGSELMFVFVVGDRVGDSVALPDESEEDPE